MKSLIVISIFFLSMTANGQPIGRSGSLQLNQIRSYVKYVDSLSNLYDSLRHSINDSANELLIKLDLGESLGEGVYRDVQQQKAEALGGFSVYTFSNSRGDSIFRILFEGGKNDAYVTQKYYYRKNTLVSSEITIRRWSDQKTLPYKVVQFYYKGKLLLNKIENDFPKIEDKSLIPTSLFKEGIRYLNLYKLDTNDN